MMRSINHISYKSTIGVVFLLFSSPFFSQQQHHVNAYPTGAGGCPLGRAAVGDAHLIASNNKKEIITGSLLDGEIDINVDRDRLDSADHLGKTFFVRVGKRTEIMLRAPYSGPGMKGFLIRLGHNSTNAATSSSSKAKADVTAALIADDTTSSISYIVQEQEQEQAVEEAEETAVETTSSTSSTLTGEETNTDEAEEIVPIVNIRLEETFCPAEQAAGLTHNSATLKYIVKGEILLLEEMDDLVLDVTVVMENTATRSEYYYSQYKFQSLVDQDLPSILQTESHDNDATKNSSKCDTSTIQGALACPIISGAAITSGAVQASLLTTISIVAGMLLLY